MVGEFHLRSTRSLSDLGPTPDSSLPFKNGKGVCPYSHAQDRSSRDGPSRREARAVVVEHLAGYLFPPELLGPLATVYGEPVTQVGVPEQGGDRLGQANVALGLHEQSLSSVGHHV